MNSSRGGDSQKWSIFLMFSLLFYLRGLPFHIAYEDKWDRVIREKIETKEKEIEFFVEIGKDIVLDTDTKIDTDTKLHLNKGNLPKGNIDYKYATSSSTPDPSQQIFNGRALLYISKNNASEPRLQGSDDQETCQILGQDGYNLHRGDIIKFEESKTSGYPLDLSSLLKRLVEEGIKNESHHLGKKKEDGKIEQKKKGYTYYFQAEFRQYRLYNRTDAPPTYLPTSCVSNGGRNGAYEVPAGTLYSDVVEVTFYPSSPSSSASSSSSSSASTSSSASSSASSSTSSTSSASSASSPSPLFSALKENNIRLTLNKMMDSFPSPGCAGNGRANSKYIKTIRMKSNLLSTFWNEEITLEACVLLPEGFYDSKKQGSRYPLIVGHGHYSPQWDVGGKFSSSPAAPTKSGYNKIEDDYAYYLYKNWTDLSINSTFAGARMLVVSINHPTPFFDDSYAVNTANMGPYGDAIMYEMIPYIEKKFRGIGEGWARSVMGGSTGGWESIATQIFYPEEINGAYASCPDPVSFASYTTFNIYTDKNAYYYESDWKRTPIPAERDEYTGQTIGYGKGPYGRLACTSEEVNHKELAMGDFSRSCGQYDVWEAAFSPLNRETGFPQRIYDKANGNIDLKVANFWKENYDLLYKLQQDFEVKKRYLNLILMKESIEDKKDISSYLEDSDNSDSKTKSILSNLRNKIHLYVGASDTFYLTNAVMDMKNWLETDVSLSNGDLIKPNSIYNISIEIGTHEGMGFEHCFSGYDYWPGGTTVLPNSITRLTYLQRFLPKMATHFRQTAPRGADITSWNY